MMENDLLNQFAKIDGWFTPDIFYNDSITESDKLTILQILLHEYAEHGFLVSKLIDGDWCFIHPDTLTKLNREQEIDNLLKENLSNWLDNSEGTLPLPIGVVLGMVDSTRLNLSQLKRKLQIEKEEGVKKWLREHGIETFSQGREKLVFEFSVDLALQLDLAHELKKQYPDSWFNIYRSASTCEKMMNAVFEQLKPTLKNEQITKRKTYTKRIL